MRQRDELVLGAVSSSRISRTGWRRGNCPFCDMKTGKADRKQCLGLHVISGKWHCFRCGSGGLVLEVPDDLSDFAPPDAALEEKVAMEPPGGFTELYREPGWSSIDCDEARAYLRGRGLDDDLGFDAGIGAVLDGCGGGCEPRCDRCRLKRRVIVPIFDVDGKEWLGWSGRAYFKNAQRKYLYPSGMRRAEILFNHAALYAESEKPAIVVEGVFDALALWPDGVAVLGKPSQFQVEALITTKRPIVVVLDGDAWREAEALSRRLRFEGQRAGFLWMKPGEDPDEMDRPELERRALACLDAE